MTTHVKVVAALFMLSGAVLLVLALMSLLLFGGLAGFVGASGEEGAHIGGLALGLTGAFLTALFALVSIPSIICGVGLLKLRPWSRILGIILAAVALVRFPLGTAFGAYALWVLLQKDTEKLFEAPIASS